MHFISEVLENYVEKYTEDEPELLQELSRETHLRVLRPRMLSGHFQGRFLSLISKLVSPKYILEIGTYTGYSAICMAEGLRKEGELHTIDINEELHDLQRKYFDRSGYGEQIKQHTGDALDILPALDIKFDLVFIDADKENYLRYFDLIIGKINKGGLILSDNVLWSGKVVEEVKPNDKSTLALLEYNKKLKEDPRVETLLLPIRDGLTICRVI
ncbi:O-methyltransferase [Sinomicrobium sp. M5D2P9]